MGARRCVGRRGAGRDVWPARPQRVGQVDADPHPVHAPVRRWRRRARARPSSARGADAGAPADRARQRGRRLLQEALGAGKSPVHGAAVRAQAVGRRAARHGRARAAGHGGAHVHHPAGRNEPGHAAEDLDRARADDQPSGVAARRADHRTRPAQPPRGADLSGGPATARRDDDLVDHARHGGGRAAVRAHRLSRSRAPRRRRHRRGAQAPCGRGHARRRLHQADRRPRERRRHADHVRQGVVMEATLDRTLRQTWAFMFRGYHLTRRYISWVIVFNFYALTGSAAVALIGVAANDHQLTLTLVSGALLWNFLSVLYNEIAMSVAYERWEGTLEYTFMAPVPRLVHLAGVSLFALCNSIVNTVIVLLGLMLLTDLSLAGANLVGVVVVLLASTLAFVGLGVTAAALPVMSPERGAEATHIFQGSLLLVSGVYYPVDVLPGWIRPISALSPATYTLSACRHLVGIGNPATTPQRLAGGPLSAVAFELSVLAMMGVVLIPLGLWVFGRVERWAKHTGRLKRTG